MTANPHPRVFFLHVMKTAGTSFAWTLVQQFDDDAVYPPAGDTKSEAYWLFDRFAAEPPEVRERVQLVHGHYPFFAGDLVGADVTITILREPIARLISHLRQIARSGPGDDVPIEQLYDESPFVAHLQNYQLRQFSREVDDDPVHLDRSHLRRGVERLDEVDVLGFSEHYAGFVDACNARFGWSCATDDRLRVAPPSPPLPASFLRRLEQDNELDVAFHQLAVEHLAART